MKKIVKDDMWSLKKYGMLISANTVFEAAALLKRKRIEIAPIFDDKSGKLIGLFKSSCVRDLWVEGKLKKTTKLTAISKLTALSERDYEIVCVNDSIKNVSYNGILTLVVDADNKIIGVVP